MTTTTFLEMCQEFAGEAGIAGGTGPTSVIGQSGDNAKIVRYIRTADISLQSKYADWDFLWATYSVTLTAATQLAPAASDTVGMWDLASGFWLNPGLATERRLTYIPWEDWHGRIRGQILTEDPVYFTIRPDRRILLNTLVPSTTPTARAYYWKTPTKMTANTSTSDVPEQWYRLIILRALIQHGVHENAPEIVYGAQDEYNDLFPQFESAHAPGHREMAASMDHTGLVMESV